MKKYLFVLLFTSVSHLVFAQSELRVVKNANDVTRLENLQNKNNTVFGENAGVNIINGLSNVLIGDFSGTGITNASENTYIGLNAGNFSPGDGNVGIGTMAGQDINGLRNVFLGYHAGKGAGNINHRMYIANSEGDSTQALLYGEFDNQYLRLNAKVNVSDNLLLDGNLGIGIPDPIFKIDIDGGLDARMRISSPSNNNSFAGLVTQNATRQFFIGTQAT